MFNIDPQTLVYGFLVLGYSLEAVHCVLANWPNCGWTARALWERLKRVRINTVISVVGAICIVCGYSMLMAEKAKVAMPKTDHGLHYSDDAETL